MDKITTIQIMTKFVREIFARVLAGDPTVSGLTYFVKNPKQAPWDNAEADILAQAIMFMCNFNPNKYNFFLHEREEIEKWVEWYDRLKGE